MSFWALLLSRPCQFLHLFSHRTGVLLTVRAFITMSEPSISTIQTHDGIFWHCERRGTGPDLVLIPSGEGDCENFATVTSLLAPSSTVTTFDMPGMSRSTTPDSAMTDLTPSKLAAQILGLMDKLNIDKATFWGCSSGALAGLALAAKLPSPRPKHNCARSPAC